MTSKVSKDSKTFLDIHVYQHLVEKYPPVTYVQMMRDGWNWQLDVRSKLINGSLLYLPMALSPI